MGQKVHKLDRREADRYTLPESELRKGRFAPGFPVSKSQIQVIDVHDVSYSGIGFDTPEANAPQVGEIVGIEFQLPDYPKVAWYAKVVRTELLSHEDSQQNFVRIGAQFIQFPVKKKKDLELHIEWLMEKADPSLADRYPRIAEALKIHRLHEDTPWRWVQTALILALSFWLAFLLLNYISGFGSSEMRWKRAPFWPGYEDHKPVSPIE